MTDAEKVQRNTLSNTHPVALHDHTCAWCGETIHRGKVHVKHVYGDHKVKHTKRYHVACWEEM